MAGNPIIAGDALARGLRSEFINTWQARYQGVRERLAAAMEFDLPSTLSTEIYGYYEQAPYPRRRPWGQQVETKPFRARNFEVENFAWSSAVQWQKQDRIFDQIRDLERAARRAGENYGTLRERVFYQIITAGTDAELLEVVPNAPDGAALYSATDGASADRFGVTGGNIETGTGVATSDAVRDDFFNGIERLFRFQDTEGQPALDAGSADQGFLVTFNVANWKVFSEAFIQTRVVEGSATPTNVVLEAGFPITLLPTQRITDNDWFVFSNAMDPKPVFSQLAQALEEHIETEENSDLARRTKLESIWWEEIAGYGVNLPLGTVKVNN